MTADDGELNGSKESMSDLDCGARPVEVDQISEARRDPAAFADLCRRHYDRVFRYCVHRLFARAAAEDVTSTVFLKVVGGLDSFRGDEQDFVRWLWRIATNTVNAHLRKAARRERLLRTLASEVRTENTGVPLAADEAAETRLALRKAILELRPRYQAIIALRFFEDMSVSEIAAMTGGSPSTVRSQLSRALARLRRAMARSGAGRELG